MAIIARSSNATRFRRSIHYDSGSLIQGLSDAREERRKSTQIVQLNGLGDGNVLDFRVVWHVCIHRSEQRACVQVLSSGKNGSLDGDRDGLSRSTVAPMLAMVVARFGGQHHELLID